MSETIYLERLEQRYIVYLKLVAKSRIHVGSTQEGTLKRMVWMNVNGKLLPAIPAESFKGALRKLAAKIAKSIDFQNPEIKEIVAYHTQDRHSRKEKDKLIYPEFIKNANIEDTLKKIFNEEQLKELSYDARNELYLSLKCPVCRLFGSRGLAGKMLLEDVLLIDEPKTNIYTSTSIDRKNKTVASERLFR
jgi:CRISPR/Cas system CSM-associated protein Csm3 (group 7 of RAMP superfamily)